MVAPGDSLISRAREDAKLQDRIALLALAIFSGLALFALTAAWPVDTHDGETHIRRVEALTGALRAGVIFPRWFPDHMLGYGTPVLNYYASGFYYPPALLHLAGIDLVSSMRIAHSLGFGFSAWWMFRFSRMYVSLWPAIVSVICFQFFPYRIYDLFVRGAFPEFSPFIWLPLIAFCTIRAATMDWKALGGSSFPLLLVVAALAWAGLIVTHNLSALMAVLLLGAALIVFTIFQQRMHSSLIRIFFSIFAPVAIGMVLTAWYVVPALLELGWVMNGHRLFTGFGFSNFLAWKELVDFEGFYPYDFPRDRPRLPIYFIPTGLAALAAASKARSRKLQLFTLVTLTLTLGLGWMMTDTSTWLWIRSELFFDQVQFPWRWQIFVALGVALLLGASIESLRISGRPWSKIVSLLSLLISVYLIAYATGGLSYKTSEDAPNLAHWSDSFEDLFWQSSVSPWALHLLPVWSANSMVDAAKAGRKPWEDLPVPDPISSVAVMPSRAGLLQQEYLVTTEQTFQLLFHQFYFPAWHVTVDGVQVDAEPAPGLGLASVTIPRGAHEVEIKWGTTAAVWLGRLVTTAGWLGVFLVLSQKRNLWDFFRKRKRIGLSAVWRFRLPVVWIAIGALMLLAASGIAARTWYAEAIAADYGFVRLEGVRSNPPMRAGEVAPVHLTWLVTGPGEPVRAFVHLVDEKGNGLSQNDVPPGGRNTPYQSWVAGLILHSTHNITMPDSLPAGRYRLIAGLYYPEKANDPLVPINGNSPRLEIGSLEVLP